MKLTRSGKWILYDWANSAFALTILTVLFPLLYRTYWASNQMSSDEITNHLGIVNSTVGIVVALTSPLFASLSSLKGHRKSYLIFWGMVSIIASGSLAFVPHGVVLLPIILFAIARIGFQLSNLFYDSMLVDVASPKRYHRVSSLGYGFGYIGGAILFIITIFISDNYSIFGLSSRVDAQRLAFILVSLWWFIFAIPLWKLKVIKHKKENISTKGKLSQMWSTTKNSLKLAYNNKNIFRFLLAYWLYIDGVHTVILMAIDFGLSLGFSQRSLLLAILGVQFIAFPFSLLAGILAEKFRVKVVISIILIIYIFITLIGGLFMKEAYQFTWFAILTGMIQGGVQALSRSFFSTIIPVEHSTELFGVYNMVGRFAGIIGPLIFVIAASIITIFPTLCHGEVVRLGMSSLSLLFIAGLFMLFRVREPRVG